MRKTEQELMHEGITLYRECARLLAEMQVHMDDAYKMVKIWGDDRGNIERDFHLQLADDKRRAADKLKKKARRITRKAFRVRRRNGRR
jgi:hypothetical protein